MKKIRKNVFETNSSSTHSLSIKRYEDEHYVLPNSKLQIEFIDTDENYQLSSLVEKVSYLVSHIINKYKYHAIDYQDLIEDVKKDYDFQRISDYVLKRYKKQIVFPKTYDGDLEYIVNINHQLVESSLEEVLQSLYNYDRDLLDEVLASNIIIDFGRD